MRGWHNRQRADLIKALLVAEVIRGERLNSIGSLCRVRFETQAVGKSDAWTIGATALNSTVCQMHCCCVGFKGVRTAGRYGIAEPAARWVKEAEGVAWFVEADPQD